VAALYASATTQGGAPLIQKIGPDSEVPGMIRPVGFAYATYTKKVREAL